MKGEVVTGNPAPAGKVPTTDPRTVTEQRDDARKQLVEANGVLRTFAQVIKRRGMHTDWDSLERRLARLLEQQRLAINEFNGYTDRRYSEYPELP